MAEKLVTGIQELTISSATYHGVKINPTYVNYFFGNNGVGKTTIAREITKLKRPANELSGGEEPKGVLFEPGKTHRDFNFLVYNDDFIRENFRQLEHLPGVFMIDKEGIKQEDDLNATKKEKDDVDREYGELLKQKKLKESVLTTMGTTLENDCWNLTKAIREKFPETQMSGTKTKKGFLSKIRTVQAPTGHDEDELKKLYDTVFDRNARTYNLFKRISDTEVMDTVPGLELLSKRIVSSSDTDFARFIKALNATDWVRQGHEKYHNTPDGKCPYCQQKMPATFEKDLADCFDESYQQEVSALGQLLQAYKTAGNNLWRVLQDNLQDVYPKIDPTEYRDKMTILKNAIGANIQIIEQKIKEASNEMLLDPIAPYLEELNELIDEFNIQIKENNDIVNAARTKKKECTEQVWELMAFRVGDTIAKYNSDLEKVLDDQKKIDDAAKKKQAYAMSLAEKINELNKHTVNTEEAIANMNKMLRDSGFQGFSIQEHPASKNQYQIVREDGTVADRLSEGERNFIAFLYFCNLVHGSGCTRDAQVIITDHGEEMITDGRDMRDKIVVIDDPVSSMDSSTLFIVSSLVRQMISICLNNVTLGEKPEKGDYIKQIFILTHNAYFHREVTVNQEKNYLRVSFYLITKYDNKSVIKHCITKNEAAPSEKKNYNPVQNSYAALWTEYNEVKSSITLKNVIRRILEYYFIQICGYDGHTLQDIILVKNRHRFVKVIDESTGEEDTTELRMVSSMINYLAADSFGVNEGLHFVEDSIAPEIYKDLTKRIFEAMGQPQHYQMMSSIFVYE